LAGQFKLLQPFQRQQRTPPGAVGGFRFGV
jgi:hypothetical protein